MYTVNITDLHYCRCDSTQVFYKTELRWMQPQTNSATYSAVRVNGGEQSLLNDLRNAEF